MKLLRYGAPGNEKPGLLDNTHTIRDLSGVIDDIAVPRCCPRGSSACAASTRRRCPPSPPPSASVRAWAASASSSASG